MVFLAFVLQAKVYGRWTQHGPEGPSTHVHQGEQTPAKYVREYSRSPGEDRFSYFHLRVVPVRGVCGSL